MKIFTTGGMEIFNRYTSITKAFSLMFFTCWIFSSTEGETVSAVAGIPVSLHCMNTSISTVKQLTWEMDSLLFSFIPGKALHVTPEARSLNINMSKSEGELYALIIEEVQISHSGNYTCKTTTDVGVLEQTWELIITESKEEKHLNKLVIAAAVAVPCVCVLVFITTLTIIIKACKRQTGGSVYTFPEEMQGPREEIYENCLEKRFSNQQHQNKPRAHRRGVDPETYRTGL
ncbi:uncharacterized protein LOC121522477 [Cheilinus undulatus]|uniref:uncharacterized protein LOC121522477 n=1 Tax=Cheilinus undulatus TaxID=241271 RepID=UPI001BD437E6|nr:uncharacterized protein LOC121522477 [Cheilinus undulatus]